MEALAFSVAQISPNKLPDNLSAWTGYAWIAVILSILGWLIDSRRKATEIIKLRAEVSKLNAEVNKLKTEEIKLAGDFLKELQHHRDIYADACMTCNTHAKTLISLLRESPRQQQPIIHTRNLFCQAVTREALHHFCSLVEWNTLSRKHSPDHLLHYIRTDITAELARISRWVEVINLPMFIVGFGCSPLIISEQTMRPFYDVL